ERGVQGGGREYRVAVATAPAPAASDLARVAATLTARAAPDEAAIAAARAILAHGEAMDRGPAIALLGRAGGPGATGLGEALRPDQPAPVRCMAAYAVSHAGAAAAPAVGDLASVAGGPPQSVGAARPF